MGGDGEGRANLDHAGSLDAIGQLVVQFIDLVGMAERRECLGKCQRNSRYRCSQSLVNNSFLLLVRRMVLTITHVKRGTITSACGLSVAYPCDRVGLLTYCTAIRSCGTAELPAPPEPCSTPLRDSQIWALRSSVR